MCECCVALISVCSCFFHVYSVRMRPVDVYRARALLVCKVCGHPHDIMTDELIISKSHWISNMGEETLLEF